MKSTRIIGMSILVFVLVCSMFLITSINQDSLEVLNPYSKPEVGGMWTTQIKTKGESTLEIIQTNTTRLGFDIIISEITCGNESIEFSNKNSSISISNYSCNEITSIEKEVLTIGKHNFNISFADQIKQTQNLASITRTYNMNNRATFNHRAYEKGNAAPTSPTNFDAEATNTDYNNLASSNNVRWATSRANTNNEYDSQIYHINISEEISTINQLDVVWEGLSSEVRANYDLSFFIWDNSINAWEQIQTDSDGSTTEVTWSNSYTTNIENYVDENATGRWVYLYARFQHYVAPVSCPFVYSYDGNNYTLEHEAFPFSVMKASKDKTFDRLQHLKEVNGTYSLKIREELEEVSFVDSFDFYVVDHNSTGFVMPDNTGKIKIIENLSSPKTCNSHQNISCIPEVSIQDEIFLSDNFKNIEYKNTQTYKDNYLISFTKPINSSVTSANLFLNVQKQAIMTKAWSMYSEVIGENNWNMWQALISYTPLKDVFNNAFDKAVNLQIEVKNSQREFRKVGSIKAGMHMLDDFLFTVNLTDINTSKDLEFRISSIKGFYEIDYIAIDYTQNKEMNVKKVSPQSSILNSEKEVSELLANSDSNYVQLVKGDEIDLTYRAPKKNSSFTTRDYAISIEGYYNFINYKDQSFTSFIKGVSIWVSSLLSPERIPEIIYNNVESRDSKESNTLSTDYVEVEVSSQEGVTWNQSTYGFPATENGNTSTVQLQFNSTNSNSNVDITQTGNASGIISINQSTFSDMLHSDIRTVEITCNPNSTQVPGVYEAIFNVDSNQHPAGDDLTVTCEVTDVVFPQVTIIEPIENTTFIDPIEVNITANVTDNTGISLVEARIEYDTTTDIITLPNTGGDTFSQTYSIPSFNGRYNVTILATDLGSNENNTQTTYFIVRDEFAPNITQQYPTSSFTYGFEPQKEINISINEPNSLTFNITFDAESPATIRWFRDSIEQVGSINLTEYTFTGGYTSQGNYTILVNVSNSIGFDYRQFNLEVINQSEPELFVFSPQNISYTTDQILINFTSTFPTLDSLWYFNGTQNISYSSPVIVTVPQGSNTFNFYANNSLGELQNVNVTFFVDSIAPSVEFIEPLNNTEFANDTIFVNISSNGDTIELFNGVSNQSYTGPSLFTFPQGLLNITAWAQDIVGNINSTTISILIDSIQPVLSIFSPLNQEFYNTSSVLINFTATDLNLDSLWYFNETANISYSSPNFITMPDGNYEFTFYANDTLNNIGSQIVNFTVDTTPPLLNITSPIDGRGYNSTILDINFTATDLNLDSLWYFNGSENVSYAGPVSIPFLEGNYEYILYANDSASNIASQRINFTIDNSPPLLSIFSPQNNDSYFPSELVLINFTATDLNLDSLWYFNGTANVSYSSPVLLNLSNGDYEFIFYANDTAGNKVSEQRNFSITPKDVEEQDVLISKRVSNINSNLYLIEFEITNNLNNNSNMTLVDIVPSNFVGGGYSISPNISQAITSGQLNVWNISISALSTFSLNYLASGVGDYNVEELYRVSLE